MRSIDVFCRKLKIWFHKNKIDIQLEMSKIGDVDNTPLKIRGRYGLETQYWSASAFIGQERVDHPPKDSKKEVSEKTETIEGSDFPFIIWSIHFGYVNCLNGSLVLRFCDFMNGASFQEFPSHILLFFSFSFKQLKHCFLWEIFPDCSLIDIFLQGDY